jgi:hypothetical protein
MTAPAEAVWRHIEASGSACARVLADPVDASPNETGHVRRSVPAAARVCISQPVAQSRVEDRLDILERRYGVRDYAFGDLEVLGVQDGPVNG